MITSSVKKTDKIPSLFTDLFFYFHIARDKQMNNRDQVHHDVAKITVMDQND